LDAADSTRATVPLREEGGGSGTDDGTVVVMVVVGVVGVVVSARANPTPRADEAATPVTSNQSPNRIATV
jgi:hypothetical protein